MIYHIQGDSKREDQSTFSSDASPPLWEELVSFFENSDINRVIERG